MSITADKALSFIAGATGLFLMAFFAWWLWWERTADAYQEDVRTLIQRQEMAWSRSSNTQIRYHDLIASGFPFTMYIRLLHPTITLSTAQGPVQLTTSYLDISEVDRASGHYQLDFPQDLSLTLTPSAKSSNWLHLHLFSSPLVEVRHHAIADSKGLLQPTQYGLTFSGSTRIDISKGKQSYQRTFNTTSTAEPVWHTIPQSLRGAGQWIRQLAHENANEN